MGAGIASVGNNILDEHGDYGDIALLHAHFYCLVKTEISRERSI